MTPWGIALEAMRRRRVGNGPHGELTRAQVCRRAAIAESTYWRLVYGCGPHGPTSHTLHRVVESLGSFMEFGQYMDQLVINGHPTEEEVETFRPLRRSPSSADHEAAPVGRRHTPKKRVAKILPWRHA